MIRNVSSIIALLLLASCGAETGPESPVADLGAGRAIAEDRCSGCHGLDGRGKTSEIPNLAAQPAEYLVEAMQAYREDRRHHSALQELISGFSEADVRNIAAHFAALPPLPPAPDPPAEGIAYREGAEIAKACFSCHGENGFSTEPGIPNLAGQQPIYLMVSTQEYASGARGHEVKEEMLAGLEQIDLEKMALFFAAQLPPRREPPPFGNPAVGEPLTASCGGCHGARGVSHDPVIPSLAGQEPNYLVSAIRAYRDHERSHEDMITNRSDEDIENIAAYYSVQ
ncbi:MAG: c-type cytochrome, partial [Xanthomonadales bacterium]|nr:c-type cytochrome [Xanthomonadales bacterium]